MQIISKIPDLRAQIKQWRSQQHCIAFVPTMGNLHAGHLSLVEKALTVADRVVVSIFVNPLQFGVGEDYGTYPRTLEADCEKLQQLNTHLIFTPTRTDIYPSDLETITSVQVPGLSEILCGASRPIFFKGVATVVNLLFNLVQPDKAIFGKKDYQQLLVVKRMVADLLMPIEIIGSPIEREADGLALSSRNNYLNQEQRSIAPQLFQTIYNLKLTIEQGERDFIRLENNAKQNLSDIGFKPDYIAIRRTHALEIPLKTDQDLMILAAASLGTTRLIDNICCEITKNS
jgi:pantoate--beta-alanine ligase